MQQHAIQELNGKIVNLIQKFTALKDEHAQLKESYKIQEDEKIRINDELGKFKERNNELNEQLVSKKSIIDELKEEKQQLLDRVEKFENATKDTSLQIDNILSQLNDL